MTIQSKSGKVSLDTKNFTRRQSQSDLDSIDLLFNKNTSQHCCKIERIFVNVLHFILKRVKYSDGIPSEKGFNLGQMKLKLM